VFIAGSSFWNMFAFCAIARDGFLGSERARLAGRPVLTGSVERALVSLSLIDGAGEAELIVR